MLSALMIIYLISCLNLEFSVISHTTLFHINCASYFVTLIWVAPGSCKKILNFCLLFFFLNIQCLHIWIILWWISNTLFKILAIIHTRLHSLGHYGQGLSQLRALWKHLYSTQSNADTVLIITGLCEHGLNQSKSLQTRS